MCKQKICDSEFLNAEVAQLVEHLPSKQNVAGPSPVFRYLVFGGMAKW